MNNADRFFKIIYRGILNKIIDNGFKYSSNLSWNLRDNNFQKEIIVRYIQEYPFNYSADEVGLLLEREIQNLEMTYKISENYEIDPLFLYIYYSNRILKLKNNVLTISFDDLYQWDGFISKVDGLIFQAAFLAISNPDNIKCGYVVKHDNKRIYNILSKGMYENHMHLNGSGYSWEINWYKLICGDPFKSIKCQKKARNSDRIYAYADFENMRIFKIQAIRMYLSWIIEGKKSEHKFDILKILNAKVMVDLFSEKEKVQINYLIFKENFYFKTTSISDIFIIEREFLKNIFKQVMENKLSKFERALFNIYIAAISDIKFCFVQDNNGMGFSKFDECERIKDMFLSKKDDRLLIESVLEKYYAEKNVKGIELRIAPKIKKDLILKMRQISKINEEIYNKYKEKDSEIQKIKLGIVVHYIKSKSNEHHGCRHIKLRKDIKSKSVALNKYFETKIPYYMRDIVPVIGVDAANAEIYCPPEVFALAFRLHREKVDGIHKVGFTYHVGEEYINITSGLRAIDDVLEFMNFTRGDRLGHAIALGIDINKYFSIKRMNLINTLQGMVDDIVWLHRMNENQMHESMDIQYRLEKKYREYAIQLFEGTGIDVPDITDYWLSYCLRGDNPDQYQYFQEKEKYLRQSVDFNYQNKNHSLAIRSEKARNLYHCYHFNIQLRINGIKKVVEDVNEIYVTAIKMAQDKLHNKIYKRGIIIEVNPTSNRKISSITKNEDLPLWKFNRNGLTKKENNNEDLMVCINTDDSAIFQTNLSNEYSIIALDLIKSGENEEDVMKYIDYLRELSQYVTFL